MNTWIPRYPTMVAFVCICTKHRGESFRHISSSPGKMTYFDLRCFFSTSSKSPDSYIQHKATYFDSVEGLTAPNLT